MIQYYSYTLHPSHPGDVESDLTRVRFGITSSAAIPSPWPVQADWPTNAQGIFAVTMPDDQLSDLNESSKNWIELAAPGQKLEVCYRSLRLQWKSGRAYVQGPEALVSAAITAVLDYALLARLLDNLEQRARALGDNLLLWQEQSERASDIVPLRKQLAEATRLSLLAVDLCPYGELPARTGEASPMLRLRTELLSQAQYSDALDLAVCRINIVVEGLESRLQRTQEMRRGRIDAILGGIIVLLLVVDLLLTKIF